MRLMIALVLVVSLSIPIVSAQPTPHDIMVYARESGCPDGRDFCFALSGSLDNLQEGDTVTFTLVNEGNAAHELVVVPYANRDPAHRATDESTALGEIEEIEPGTSDTATFTVPASGLYFWCALAGHEALGMWVEAPVEQAGKESPGLGMFAMLGLLGVVLLLRTRR